MGQIQKRLRKSLREPERYSNRTEKAYRLTADILATLGPGENPLVTCRNNTLLMDFLPLPTETMAITINFYFFNKNL